MTEKDKKKIIELFFDKVYNYERIELYFNKKYTYNEIRKVVRDYYKECFTKL